MLSSPKCCGKEMRKKVETIEFEEFHCEKCGDIVYIKKDSVRKPELIDD
jgi:hypothetical protein